MSVQVCTGKSLDEPIETFTMSRGGLKLCKKVSEVVKGEVVPLDCAEYSVDAVKAVLEFCDTIYKVQYKPASARKDLTAAQIDNISNWKKKFCGDRATLLGEFALVADQLGVEDAATIATTVLIETIKETHVGDLGAKLGIESDFTPQEQVLLHRENMWSMQW